MNMNERQPNETLQHYHNRRDAAQKAVKRRGWVIWHYSHGTYIRKKHGEIGLRSPNAIPSSIQSENPM